MRTKWDFADWSQFAVAALIVPFGIVSRCAGILLVTVAFAGVLVLHRFHLRLANNRGWLSGRVALIQSMLEAQQRNMAMADWLTAEAERDGLGPEIRAAMRDADEG